MQRSLASRRRRIGLHPVLDPLQPLLQLDDLLGHPGELGPRGEVEGLQRLRRSPARRPSSAGACAASICSSERPIIWAKRLGAHRLARARATTPRSTDRGTASTAPTRSGRGRASARTCWAHCSSPWLSTGRQNAIGSGAAAGGVAWVTMRVQAWVRLLELALPRVEQLRRRDRVMPPLPSASAWPASRRDLRPAVHAPRPAPRSARCGRRAARCSPSRGCSTASMSARTHAGGAM